MSKNQKLMGVITLAASLGMLALGAWIVRLILIGIVARQLGFAGF